MQLRFIVGFIVRFLLVYGVLIALWPGVRGTYGTLFRTGGEFVSRSFGSTAVRFRALPNGPGVADTKILVRKREGDEPFWFLIISCRRIGYVSSATLAGLILATPIPWPRRGRAFFWGMILLHAFVALRLATLIIYGFTLDTPGPLALPDAFWGRTLRAVILTFSVGQGLSYIVPILIWMLVSLRREDLAMILPGRRLSSLAGAEKEFSAQRSASSSTGHVRS